MFKLYDVRMGECTEIGRMGICERNCYSLCLSHDVNKYTIHNLNPNIYVLAKGNSLTYIRYTTINEIRVP